LFGTLQLSNRSAKYPSCDRSNPKTVPKKVITMTDKDVDVAILGAGTAGMAAYREVVKQTTGWL